MLEYFVYGNMDADCIQKILFCKDVKLKGGNRMNKLEKYIEQKYDNDSNWFESEVKNNWHLDRINESLDEMEYLDGRHKISKRADTVWKGRHFKTRKVVLQLVKPILTFQSSFILSNPVTLTSDDENTLKIYKDIYKKGKYNNIDIKILDNLIKYGEVFEYLYWDEDKLKSSIIRSVDGYPVINNRGEYIAFIEHYISDSISYYTIYEEDVVSEYNNQGGQMQKVAEYNNLTGLPIRYLLPSECDEYAPRSDMKDWINIVDEMEDLLSKYADSFYKFLNPLGVMTGTKLSTGKNGEGAIDPNMAGQVLQLDHMSTFDYETAQMDYQSFKEEYKILEKNLLNISMTPSIAMSGLEIANISTDSMKILFHMAKAKATMTSKYLYEGMDERWKKISIILQNSGIEDIGYVSGSFKFDIPNADSEVVDNLVKMHDVGRVSRETFLSQAPYILDVATEVAKLDNSEVVK